MNPETKEIERDLHLRATWSQVEKHVDSVQHASFRSFEEETDARRSLGWPLVDLASAARVKRQKGIFQGKNLCVMAA
jgi:hypothetical protein